MVHHDSAASLTLMEGELSGSLSGIRNYGRITLCRVVDSTWTGDFYQAHLMLPDITGLDSVIASTCGGQQPPGFTRAVSQWWHVCSAGDSIRTDTADITFWYEDTMLNNLPEDQLEVWHSADSGRS